VSHSYNYLETLEPEPVQKAHKRKRGLKTILLIGGFLFVVWGIVLSLAVGQIVASMIDAKEVLLEAQDSVEHMQFNEAKLTLEEANTYFVQAEKASHVLKTVEWVPYFGSYLKSLRLGFSAAEQIVTVFIELSDIGSELVRLSGYAEEELAALEGTEHEITFDSLSAQTRHVILERLSNTSSDILLAKTRLTLAREELESIDQSLIFSAYRNFLNDVLDKLHEAESQLDTLVIVSSVVPELAGVESEQTILLQFLNNTELRPGGGFIGTYGIAKVKDGDLVSLQTEDVYNLDRLTEGLITTAAPAPLQTYNNTKVWYFRDANWSPDFAISSYKSIERFVAEVDVLTDEQKASIPTARSIHAVLGFTPTLAADILEIVGDITVLGQTFTPENMADALEYQVEYAYVDQGIPETQRKQILADMVEEVKTRLYALSLSDWMRVLEVVQESVEKKQIALYSSNQEIEELLIHAGWAGRVVPNTPDHLMVVDANLASLKSDPAVDREIIYRISKNTQGEYVGTVTVNYHHAGVFDWKTTRYRTYTRLYVPLGSELIAVHGSLANDKIQNPSLQEGVIDEFEDLEMQAYAAFTSIEPGEDGQLVFEFLLAPSVVEEIEKGSYLLEIFKQMGSTDYALTLDLDFDKNVTSATPGEDENEWGNDVYSLNTYLDQDTTISISL
jgi:hypothetical protein